jgi:hypothetical protein
VGRHHERSAEDAILTNGTPLPTPDTNNPELMDWFNPSTWSTRMQNSALVFLGGAINLWFGYLIAWGWLPEFIRDWGDWPGIILASFFAPILFALLQFIFIGRDKFIAYVGSLKQDPSSKVRAVVLRSDAEAAQFPQPGVVGPSDVRML